MIVKLRYLVILQLIVAQLLVTSANNVRGRRRPGVRTEATAVEEVTEKAAGPDQIAMATRTEPTRYTGISSTYTTSDQETENYPYELNLIRPESQYQTNQPAGVSQYSFGNEDRDLDDVETAEEYVAKAMQMYGTRLKEPLQIHAEAVPSQSFHKYDVYELAEPEAQTPSPAAASVYEKDPVTRSYDVFDYSTYETVSEQQFEPKYEPKYRYQQTSNVEPVYVAPPRISTQENERVKTYSSSEIPKEEILKQIEKSVIKYMKEMEADGKIPLASEPKTTYYKLQPVETTQRATKTTPKPKQPVFHYTTTNRSNMPRNTPKPSQPADDNYQTSTLQQELSESLAPNVEFIYKIKARAPLQSLQASRPQQSSSKAPLEQFDHSAALKNMEEFDLTHVVPEERAPNKPKLFFNSEIYHDINSLPYKPEKVSIPRPQKVKEHPDYKGYSLFSEARTEDDSEDSGYPIMNPYQFSFKKEPSASSLVAQSPSNWENSHSRPYIAPQQKPQLEYDTYSPKYNNNPEGYGYQHQHGQQQNHKFQGRHPTKRGKRGGSHPHGNKKGSRGSALNAKDVEASVALRPPPKV